MTDKILSSHCICAMATAIAMGNNKKNDISRKKKTSAVQATSAPLQLPSICRTCNNIQHNKKRMQ